MKRLGLMLLMLPLLSSAEVVVPIDSVENNVNIRMSPDSTSEIVGRLKQGDWMLLVESTPGWHEVEISGGATGFISADWSKVLDEAPEPDEVVAANEASEEVVEEVAQAALHEPVVRLALKLDQVRDRQDLGDPGIAFTLKRHGRTPTIDFRHGHGALLASGRGDQGTGIRPHGSLKRKGPRSPTAYGIASWATRQQRPDTKKEGSPEASLDPLVAWAAT